MKKSKAVYVTKRDIRKNILHREYQLYSNKITYQIEQPLRHGQRSFDVGVQYNWKRDNVICTCKNFTALRRQQEETRYYSPSPRQLYIYNSPYRSRSITDIGVGSVKALPKKKIRRIHLPETDDRGVGSTDLSSYIVRKSREVKGMSYYDYKRTSSKCVGGVVEAAPDCVISAKVSPINFTRSGATSPKEPAPKTVLKNTEIGSNIVKKKLSTTTAQIGTDDIAGDEVTHKQRDIKSSISVTKSEHTKQRAEVATSADKSQGDRKMAEDKSFSSDSLVQHVYNLENPSQDKETPSVDPMENKLEKEYRKMFPTKSKEFKTGSTTEKPASEMKTSSALRRRFEALRRSLGKKEVSRDSSKRSVILIESHKSKSKTENPTSDPSRRDASVTSDPPSLEGRSYSNCNRSYNPYTPKTHQHSKIPRASYKRSYTGRKEEVQSSSNQLALENPIDSEYGHGVKGMFKLWGKKFNLDEDVSHENKDRSPKDSLEMPDNDPKYPNAPNSVEKTQDEKVVKKEGKKFFFFKRKAVKNKDKNKDAFKSKQGVTTGRCEVPDGLSIKIGANTKYSPTPTIQKKLVKSTRAESYEEIIRKSWLIKYLTNPIESRNSVQVRWNNRTYSTSNSTVFELMENVYKGTGVTLKSKSETITDESSYYKSYTRANVNFVQNVEAWMIPRTIPDRPVVLVNNNSLRNEQSKNIEITISDQKWFIEKSQAFAHKIEVVLHSKNFVKLHKADSNTEYLKIDIPKGFFSDETSSEDQHPGQTSDEEVYKIVEYDTYKSTSEVKKAKKDRALDTGDYVPNDIKVTISIKDKDCESNILDTVIKKSKTRRDVLTQGSNVFVPKKCDVISVGIITQRDIREVRPKPILKIIEYETDDESEHSFENVTRKCEFAESFLQDYYKSWAPLAIDFCSSCVSDSHIQGCSNNNSILSFQNGDGSKSCPNIGDDYGLRQTPMTSFSASSCSQIYPTTAAAAKVSENDNFNKNVKKKKKKDEPSEDNYRVLPKDSLEVFKKRQQYANSNKSNWGDYEVTSTKSLPHSPPSRTEQGKTSPGPGEADCPKLKRLCNNKPQYPSKKERPCLKHVSLPDCDTMNEELAKKLADPDIPGILTFGRPQGCDTCNNKKGLECPKNLRIESKPCEIKEPQCKKFCMEEKHPHCEKKGADDCTPNLPKACRPPPISPKKSPMPLPPPNRSPPNRSPPQRSPPQRSPPKSSPPRSPPDSQPCSPSESPPQSPERSPTGSVQSRHPKCPPSPPKCCRSRKNAQRFSSLDFERRDYVECPPEPPCPPKPPCCPPPPPYCPPASPSRKKKGLFGKDKTCPAFPQPKPCPANPPPKPCPAIPKPKACPAVPKTKPCPANPEPKRCPAYPEPKSCPAHPEPKSCPAPPKPKCPEPQKTCGVTKECSFHHAPCPPKYKPPTEPKSPCFNSPMMTSATVSRCSLSPCRDLPPPPKPKPVPPGPKLPCSGCPTTPCHRPTEEELEGLKCKHVDKCEKKCEFVSDCPSDHSKQFNRSQDSQTNNMGCVEPPDCSRFSQPRTPARAALPPPCPKTPSPTECSSVNKGVGVGSTRGQCSHTQTPRSKLSVCDRDCSSRSRIAGIHLKKKAAKKKTCSSECMAWEKMGSHGRVIQGNVIRINSRERITIKLRDENPSTDEIREPNCYIARDAHGQTVYESEDRPKWSESKNHPLLEDIYKDSKCNRVSAPLTVNEMQSLEKAVEDDNKSNTSVANLIEINFKLRVAQGDKMTEINIGNEGDVSKEEKRPKLGKNPQDIFMMKDNQEAEAVAEGNNNSNDINIRIIIKNFKPEPKKNTGKFLPCTMDDDFSKKISEKFQTVSTGYDTSIDFRDVNAETDRVFSIHRATVDLTTSASKTVLDTSGHELTVNTKVYSKLTVETNDGDFTTASPSTHKIVKERTEIDKNINSNPPPNSDFDQRKAEIETDTSQVKTDHSKVETISNSENTYGDPTTIVAKSVTSKIGEVEKLAIKKQVENLYLRKSNVENTDTDDQDISVCNRTSDERTDLDNKTSGKTSDEPTDLGQKSSAEASNFGNKTSNEPTLPSSRVSEGVSGKSEPYIPTYTSEEPFDLDNKTSDDPTELPTSNELTDEGNKTSDECNVSKKSIDIPPDYSTKSNEIVNQYSKVEDDVINKSDEKESCCRKLIKRYHRQEKKELLKKVFENGEKCLKRPKTKNRIQKLKNMLKAILTSDSSEPDELVVTSNRLAEDITYNSIKPAFFKNSDSLNNYLVSSTKTSEKNSDDIQIKYHPTVEFNSMCSNGDSEWSLEDGKREHQGCMCTTLASRLKMKMCNNDALPSGGGGCCCRKKATKTDQETFCDIRNDDEFYFLKYQSAEVVDVETQNSRYFSSNVNSMHMSVGSKGESLVEETVAKVLDLQDGATVENVADEVAAQIMEPENALISIQSIIKSSKLITKQLTPITSYAKEKTKTRLGISDDDKIVFLETKSTRICTVPRYTNNDEDDKKDRNGKITKPADILQLYETKKAVLEIYAEKIETEDGEHIVAKLPKFVLDGTHTNMDTNEHTRNKTAHYSGGKTSKKVKTRNLVMMSIGR